MTQAIDYYALGPPLLLAVGAVVVLLIDLIRPARVVFLGLTALSALAASAVAVAMAAGERRGTFCVPPEAGAAGGLPSCSLVVDPFTLPLWVLLLAGTAVVVLLSLGTLADERQPAGEYFFLLLSSAAGAMTLVAARDLITLIIALEVVSLPAYALVALRRTAQSGEAALKFFLLSIVSTAITLFGAALIYGVTGAVHLDRIAGALTAPAAQLPLTTVAMVLLLVGFGFKVAAVPFHAWAPETYAGAPVPIAAYLSVVSKAAAVGGLLLILTVAFAPYADSWAPILAVLAAVTLTVGNVAALRYGVSAGNGGHHSPVRLLAWSSIAQSGWILVPLAAGAGRLDEARSASVAYLLAYALMSLTAFTVVAVISRRRPGTDLDVPGGAATADGPALRDYRGLARREPLTAAALTFALICLAGLPPGLLGVFAKIAVFTPPIGEGLTWLGLVMAVNVVLGLAYYLPWAASLYASPYPDHAPPTFRLSVPEGLALGGTFAALVSLSVLPLGIFGSAGV